MNKISKTNTLQENTSVLQSKSRDLVGIAERKASDYRRVILLNRLPRLDCKKELKPLMDQLVAEEMQKTKKQNIFVEDLGIFLMSGDESDIFGPPGV